MSVTRVTTPEDEEEDYIPCICCPKSVKRTLATMLDFSLMRSPSFILLAVSGFMSTLGVYIPYLYLVEATTKQGQMDPKISVYLMTVLGSANAVGRLSCGLLSFFPSIKVLEFSTASLFLAGITTCLSTISYDRITQFCYVVVYGAGLGKRTISVRTQCTKFVCLFVCSCCCGNQTVDSRRFSGIRKIN